MIFGTAYDETLGDRLRVTVIATGLSSANRKAQITPPLAVVQPQTHAPQHAVAQALHTGTDNIPVLVNQVPGLPQQPNHDNLNTPSVWRHGRTQAAAKVEALSSNRMDEIEIPAFLRKQPD